MSPNIRVYSCDFLLVQIPTFLDVSALIPMGYLHYSW